MFCYCGIGYHIVTSIYKFKIGAILLTAKEYYEKHEHSIMGDVISGKDATSSVSNLVEDISEEAKAEIRSNRLSKAEMVNALSKANDKWNGVSRLFWDKYGFSPLAEDILKASWIEMMPELEVYFS